MPRDTIVWTVDLDAVGSAGPETLLAPDEQARADAFVSSEHRRRWIAARAALRLVLGAASGLPAARLAFERGASGKPRLRGGGSHFNLSHSGSVALIAVCAHAPVGVDVEQGRRLGDLEGMARLVMSDLELAAFRRLPGPERGSAFLRLWTRKEAALKAEGSGLLADPREVMVGLDAAPRRNVEVNGSRLTVADLLLDWTASVASPDLGAVALRRFAFP